eukprot:13162633-Heterocapsa_arctica.AAC.1
MCIRDSPTAEPPDTADLEHPDAFRLHSPLPPLPPSDDDLEMTGLPEVATPARPRTLTCTTPAAGRGASSSA